MKLSSVTLKVFDLQRSTEFYERILGLIVRKSDGNMVELGTKNKTLVILESNLNYYPPVAQRIGLYHLALLLPNESDLANFLQHVIDLQFPALGAADHLFSQAIYLNDPDGNGIEIYADRPKSQWERLNDGTLKLVSDPLKVDQLLTHKTQRWTKIPEETILGHVHLQTNHLEEIEDFYIKILNFEIQSKVPSAVFISNHGYHHDLAINVWAGPNIQHPLENETGLHYISYEVDKKTYEILKKTFSEQTDNSEKSYLIMRDPAEIESRIFLKS